MLVITHETSYDYIITGAGCAGLSLVLRMQQHPFFRDKKILLIDAADKKRNDRTWCFWEAGSGLFQNIVYKQWSAIDFYSPSFSARWEIAPYQYKMIRGIDLYNYVFSAIAQQSNIVFLQTKVKAIESQNNRAAITTEAGTFNAQYLFNSILFTPEQLQTKGSLLQHFKGWMITTKKEAFNSNVATFMDFRSRPTNENTFVYTLPISPKQALVEYTVFSASLLSQEEYTNGLREYIAGFLSLSEYEIIEEEFGVIPMTTFTFTTGDSAIVNMGTAGGQTKGSSGYTFQFIQKHTGSIVEALVNNRHPQPKQGPGKKRFKLYDDTLLKVLYSKKLTASEIFSYLFTHNKPQQIFRFLDNETTFFEELKIMSTVPVHVFLPAALKQLSAK